MNRPIPELSPYGIRFVGIDALETPRAIEAMREIERLGFGAFWLTEAVGRDPFVAAAVFLGATERLVLATGIASVYARDPMTMVSCHKTLVEAYPGRFLLGIGVSHGHLVAGIRKHDYSKPYSYMTDYLDRMDRALFMARGPEVEPGRVLAALGPKMLQLSVDRAQGAHTYFTTVEHTAMARQAMGPDAFLAPEQMVVLSSDPVEARAIARAGMKIYLGLPSYYNNLARFGFDEDDRRDGGSDRLVDAIAAWGTPDQIAERIHAHLQAGANNVSIHVLTATPTVAPLREWTVLAAALGIGG